MMTREEAIKQLECLRLHCRTMIRDEYEDGIWAQDIEALDLALSALRPVSREQVEKVWRGYWIHEEIQSSQSATGYFKISSCECSKCGCYVQQEVNFCPNCGTPMTDEAVQMVMERLEELKDGSTTG